MQKGARILMLFSLVLAGTFSVQGQTEQPALPASRSDSEGGSLSKGSEGKSGTGMLLSMADSLFTARQYTQAFEMYTSLRENGFWSPAMFLKMAYIKEGLGDLGESLYYLNLYALSTNDPQAAVKMQELAGKNRLEGYDDDPVESFWSSLREYYVTIAGVLAAVTFLMLALMINRARSNKSPALAQAVIVAIAIITLFLHVHHSRKSTLAVVTQANTHLMSAPSAGASVVEIIGEGHRVRILGKADAWLRVSWRESEAYIRDGRVQRVEL